jgi:hypothetical protein
MNPGVASEAREVVLVPNKNEKILRDQDAAMETGDMDKFWAPFADDVLVHVGGRSKLGGEVKGKEGLRARFNEFMTALGENPQFETHDILANDTHGVLMQTFRGTKKNKSAEIRGVSIFHFDKGKISEAWFIDEDPYEADPFYDA